jgi:hypothetical protein
MPRPKKSDSKPTDAQQHGENKAVATKASMEQHTKAKGHLMEGIVGGIQKRTLPPVIDGVIRGVPKYKSDSLVPDMMRSDQGATKIPSQNFGSGFFADGQVGRR